MLAVAGGLLSTWMEKAAGASGAEYQYNLLERLLIAGRAAWFYVGKLSWPAQLTFIYPRWKISAGIGWQYLYPLAAAALVIAAWQMRRRSRSLLAAVLFYGGTLFPALGFLNVYPFRYSFVADHFQYLACLGLIVLTSAGVVKLLGHWPRWVGMAAGMVLVVVLGGLTWRQCRMYTDSETLYRTTIERNPECWMAHNNLGVVLVESGRAREAIEHYEQSLRLKPDYDDAHDNWGNALVQLGCFAEAIDHYESALRLRPERVNAHSNLGIVLDTLGRSQEGLEHLRRAVHIDPLNASAHFNMGNALFHLEQFTEAVEQYQAAIRIWPEYVEAYDNLGVVLARLGRLEEAGEASGQAVRLRPDNGGARRNLGSTLMRLHRPAEAMEQFREAIRLKPDFLEAHVSLSNALVSLDRWAEAVEHLSKALLLMPDQVELNRRLAMLLATREASEGGDPVRAIALAEKACTATGRRDILSLDTLAAAYAAAGRFDDAVSTVKEAWRLADSAGQTAIAEELHMRLQIYRQGKPYRPPRNSGQK